MKKLLILGSALAATMFTSCDSEDDIVNLTTSERYPIVDADTEEIIGKVIFRDLDEEGTEVIVRLNDEYDADTYTTAIRMDNWADGGNVVVTLNDVVDGESSTVLSIDASSDYSYDSLLWFDGHVTVTAADDAVIGKADIGQNKLTDEMESYNLEEVSDSGVSGDVTLYKRKNNETLVVLDLEGTPAGGDHPAHIHEGVAGSSGPIAITLNNVDGDTGYSYTNVTEKDNGDAIVYQSLINYDGYVNVHLSPSDLTVVSTGNIGSND